MAVLDFSKAFDTVPQKLERYGINGDINRWIASFLIGRRQCVVVDGARSEEAEVLSGVPQGTVLGPLLFLLHINDLPLVLHPDTRCRLFADDCLLYRAINSIEDQVQLQNDLSQIEKWATKWGMKLNASKCHNMAIYRGNTHAPYLYQLDNTIMSTVKQEKYLGVLISDDLSWAPHISNVVTTASQRLGFLARNLRGSPSDLKRTAYISMFRSTLEYAAIVWDPYQANQTAALERVQRKSARWNKGVTNMMESLRLEPLDIRRRNSRLTFLYKILNDGVALTPDDLDLVRNRRATRGLATQQKLIVPYCSTDQRKYHFAARTIPEWNRLPEATTSAESVSVFRARLTAP